VSSQSRAPAANGYVTTPKLAGQHRPPQAAYKNHVPIASTKLSGNNSLCAQRMTGTCHVGTKVVEGCRHARQGLRRHSPHEGGTYCAQASPSNWGIHHHSSAAPPLPQTPPHTHHTNGCRCARDTTAAASEVCATTWGSVWASGTGAGVVYPCSRASKHTQ
jgi:hypothetical protein